MPAAIAANVTIDGTNTADGRSVTLNGGANREPF
jgi:hypothetical protein